MVSGWRLLGLILALQGQPLRAFSSSGRASSAPAAVLHRGGPLGPAKLTIDDRSIYDESVSSDWFDMDMGPVAALTGSPLYLALEACQPLALAGLLAVGLLHPEGVDDSTWLACQGAAKALALSHVLSAGVCGALAQGKDLDAGPQVARAAAFGALELARTAALDDRETMEGKNAGLLQTEISSYSMTERMSPQGVLFVTQMEVLPGREYAVAKRLRDYAHAVTENKLSNRRILSVAINQDPQEKNCFTITERFSSLKTFYKHQESELYKTLVNGIQDCLRTPMGLYMTRNEHHKISEPRYPFGPGGEGGRDDAIFSNPANTDGSLTNFEHE